MSISGQEVILLDQSRVTNATIDDVKLIDSEPARTPDVDLNWQHTYTGMWLNVPVRAQFFSNSARAHRPTKLVWHVIRGA